MTQQPGSGPSRSADAELGQAGRGSEASTPDPDTSTGAVPGQSRARTLVAPVRSARDQVRRAPGGRTLVRVAVFVAGLAFIVLGLVLIVAPGPLTIPPILIGLYLWSTEFQWADRLLDRAKVSGREAWATAKAKPVWSAVVTGGGLVALAVGLYLVQHYDLVSRLTGAVGL